MITFGAFAAAGMPSWRDHRVIHHLDGNTRVASV